MKTIAVTGGSGASGTFIIKELLDHGYHCLNIDIAPPAPENQDLCPFVAIDLCDYPALHDAVKRCDGLVHFAGNPQPDNSHFEASDRFSNNTIAAFNAFNAANANGIKRVVWASSETIYGFPFATNLPPHLPVDETTPDAPQTGYAISKAATERVATLMAALYDMTIIGLRLSNILYDDVRVDPSYQKIPSYWGDVTARQFNLWGYIDARDAARACRLALEADLKGAHIFSIAASDSIMNIPSSDLAAKAMPDVPVTHPLQAREALTDCAKAARMLGFEPAYSWTDVLGMKDDGSQAV